MKIAGFLRFRGSGSLLAWGKYRSLLQFFPGSPSGINGVNPGVVLCRISAKQKKRCYRQCGFSLQDPLFGINEVNPYGDLKSLKVLGFLKLPPWVKAGFE